MKKSLLLELAAWGCLVAVAFVTVAPIGLRPHDPFPVDIDRALAYGLLSSLFVFAYPARWRLVLVLTIAAAGLLEASQLLSESRHARLSDATVKAVGAAAGVAFALAVPALAARLRSWKRRIAARTADRREASHGAADA